MATPRTREGKSAPTAATVLEEARQWLAEKGYRSGREHPYDEGQAGYFKPMASLISCCVRSTLIHRSMSTRASSLCWQR